MVRGDGRRQSKPGGPECTRRSTTRRNGPEALRSSATQPDAMKREPTAGTTHSRWSAATHRVGTRSESSIRHGTAPHVSSSHALKVPSSARHPDATKRDLPGCQNALTKRRCPTRRRFSSVTRRKAPAANQPRNNAQVAGIKKTNPKANQPHLKIRHGITAGASAAGALRPVRCNALLAGTLSTFAVSTPTIVSRLSPERCDKLKLAAKCCHVAVKCGNLTIVKFATSFESRDVGLIHL